MQVEHYRVIYKDHKLTIDEEEYFEELTKLVEVSGGCNGPYSVRNIRFFPITITVVMGLSNVLHQRRVNL